MGSAPVAPDVLRVLQLLDRQAELQRISPIDFYEPIPGWAEAVHAAPENERFVLGGNGSGKTELGAAEVVMLASDKATWWTDGPSEIWCSTTTLAKSVETQRPKVKKLLPPSLIKDWLHERDQGSESTLYLTNGWVIRFRASKQGLPAFESGAAALVWHDEEPAADVYDETRMRTFRCGGRILTTWTPTKGLRWKECYNSVYKPWEAFKAANPKAKWGSPRPGIFVAQASTDDNPYVPAERIDEIRRLCAHRPTLLRVRLFGEWLVISEDAIVNVDQLRFWSVKPPRWRRKLGWIDPAASRGDVPKANREGCEFAIACAGMSPEGGLFLIDYRHGRYDSAERIRVSCEFIEAHELRLVFVQPVTGDRLFRVHLRENLQRRGIECTVSEFPYEHGVPSKEERAEAFQTQVGDERVFIRREHEDFKGEAAVFPHGATNDLFDACMGAMMGLTAIPDASLLGDAVRGQLRKDERGRPKRGQGDAMGYEPGGKGGILRERL